MPANLPRARLTLDPTAIVLPFASGVLFRSDAGCCEIVEAGAYELARDVAPRLDGSSLADILQAFEPTRRAAVTRLVVRLVDEGIVHQESARRPVLPQTLRARFAPQLALLDRLASRPDARFRWFRNSPVLLAGTGASFQRCAAALIRNGLRSLWVLGGDGPVAVPEALAEAETLRKDGIEAQVHVAGERESAGPDPFAMVLYVADAPRLADVLRLAQTFRKQRCALLPAFVLGPQTLLGPILRSPACVVCVYQRVLSHLCEPRHRDLLMGTMEGLAPLPCDERLALRLGSEAAFEAFKTLAGSVRPDLERGLILTTATAESTRATFVPYSLHWCGGTCDQASANGGGARPRSPRLPATERGGQSTTTIPPLLRSSGFPPTVERA